MPQLRINVRVIVSCHMKCSKYRQFFFLAGVYIGSGGCCHGVASKGRRLRIEQRRIASFQSSSKPVVRGGLRRREIFLKHIRVLRCVNIEIPDVYLHRGRCGDRDRRFFLCIRESGYPCRPIRQPVWQPRVGSVPSERRGTEAFGRDSEDCDQSEG